LPLELRPGYEKLGRTGAGFIILILVINIPGLRNIFSTAFIGVRDFLLSNLIFFELPGFFKVCFRDHGKE